MSSTPEDQFDWWWSMTHGIEAPTIESDVDETVEDRYTNPESF